ncbi:MAG TPA: hypothetical protein VNB22_01275 [Pyrinomonadaceae bacterium]|nr:hypothetical protein [Pyrinomonadaceae bacterium]
MKILLKQDLQNLFGTNFWRTARQRSGQESPSILVRQGIEK